MNGGIIGVVNTPAISGASGVWTLEEQFLASVARIWPNSVPFVVENAAVWLDAADTTTITQVGGAVSQWNNKGTLGNFTQANGALQPTTGSTTLNGLNVLDFAGDFMQSADTAATYKFMHDGTDYVVCAVVRFGSTGDPNDVYGLLSTNSLPSPGMRLYYDDRVSVSRNNVVAHEVGVTTPSSFSVQNFSGNNAFSANTFGVLSLLADPNNGTAADRSEISVDAGTAIKNNSSTTAVSTADPGFSLRVGDLGVSSLYMTGSLAELVIVSGADATNANREIIRDYLAEKWGVY